MATPSRWLNSDVTLHVGTIADVKAHVPSFDRRPFALAQSDRPWVRENDRLDTIVRLPFADDFGCVPVGVVSKDYALLQHSSVFDETMKALEDAKIDPATVDAELRLTQFGERMKLSLRLPDVMGWFRLVCSNGLAIGITRSESDRRHVGDLQLKHIGDVLRTGIGEYKLERDTLIRWRDAEASTDDLRSWVERELRAGWGFKAASRAWHIARTGCDVNVIGPYKNHSPTTIPVERTAAVPGSPEESTSLFDISQILAWLAKERRDIQEQMEWREQIPALMASLAAA